MRRSRLLVFLAFALASCATARPQESGASSSTRRGSGGNRWEDQVQTYLSRAARVLEERGYVETQERYVESLRESRSHTIRLTLRADESYSIVGVCDNDCSDLDFKLYDDADNLIDEDMETDDTPIVSVTPRRTGEFRLSVQMADCTNEPCYFGVGVWRKR